MSSKTQFEPVASIQHARTEEAFLDAIHKSPDNDYLEKGNTSSENQPFLTVLGSRLFDKDSPDCEYFFVQNAQGLITACSTIQPSDEPEETIRLIEISTHPDFRKKCLAKSLLFTIMKHALEQNKQLIPGSFIEEGRLYLAPIFHELHALMPDLKVVHDIDAIDFSRPYRLKSTTSGGRPKVTYDEI